jgi:flagellar hook-length control protein FliK
LGLFAAASPIGAGASAAGVTPASSAPAVPIAGLAVEIVAQARDGKNRFEIRLDPPELGRIDVHLTVDRDGNVSSRLVVDRSETLDLLRRDAPTLERALENAGLKTAQQGLEFSLRDQGGRHQPYANEASPTRLIAAEVDPSSAAAISSGYGRWLGMGGGVDIRV